MAVRNTLFIAGYGPLQSPHHSYLFNIEKYRVEMTNFIGLKEIQSPWGKVMERSGLRIKNTNKGCKIAAPFFLKNFFFCKFRLRKTLIIKSIKSRFFWYWCCYPHRSRDALSHVCRIFQIYT